MSATARWARRRGSGASRVPADSTRRWTGRLDFVCVFGVAFLLRLLIPMTSGGLTGTYGYDASVYYAAGAALVHGRIPYEDFVLLHPPGAMLATAPAAWIGTFTSDQAGLVVATVVFTVFGAVNAVLVAVIGRRLGLGRAASTAGGLFYAVWFAAVQAEYQIRLEPLANLLVLSGLLGYAGIGARNGRRAAILCGIGLGAAACVKIWYAVPLLAVIAWLALAQRSLWAAARAALGAVGAIAVICGPFFAVAPTAMPEMVISQQLARDRSNALSELLALRLPTELSSRSVIYAIDCVLLTAAALLLMLAWRAPAARFPVVLLFAQAAVLLFAPSFYIFYLDYLTPALALCVAAGAARLSMTRGVGFNQLGTRAGATAAVVVVVLGALAVGLWHGRVGTARFPTAQLAPAVEQARCVMSDSPMGLIALNALSRNLTNGCRNWVDVTGRSYAADMHVQRPDGSRVARIDNLKWQRALCDYLLSGDAVIIRHASASGLSLATWDAIRGGGVVASHDGQVVYRVSVNAPQR